MGFIRDPEKLILDPGVKKAPDPGFGSATLTWLGIRFDSQTSDIWDHI
jgi:hypothetical protein